MVSTPSLNAIFERDMANLVYPPVGKPVAEVFLAVWREGDVEIDEFYGFDFHGLPPGKFDVYSAR